MLLLVLSFRMLRTTFLDSIDFAFRKYSAYISFYKQVTNAHLQDASLLIRLKYYLSLRTFMFLSSLFRSLYVSHSLSNSFFMYMFNKEVKKKKETFRLVLALPNGLKTLR